MQPEPWEWPQNDGLRTAVVSSIREPQNVDFQRGLSEVLCANRCRVIHVSLDDAASFVKATLPERERRPQAMVILRPTDPEECQALERMLELVWMEELHASPLRLVMICLQPDGCHASMDFDNSVWSKVSPYVVRVPWLPEGIRSADPLDALGNLLAREPELPPPTGAGARPPEGGALPIDSDLFVARPLDRHVLSAVARGQTLVIVRRARQMGKTSLLYRAVDQARKAGWKVVLTDMQKVTTSALTQPEVLSALLADDIADQLEIEVTIEQTWHSRRSPPANLERYLRRAVLSRLHTRLLWVIDEADRLGATEEASPFLHMLYSWATDRMVDPLGPFQRLTVLVAFGTPMGGGRIDLTQTSMYSPRIHDWLLFLEDECTPAQVEELNRMHGSPLRTAGERTAFLELLGGHPHLVRCGLWALSERHIDIATLRAVAASERGPFGDHLRGLLFWLTRDERLCQAAREVMAGKVSPDPASIFALIQAGILTDGTPDTVQFRCRLYAWYLSERL